MIINSTRTTVFHLVIPRPYKISFLNLCPVKQKYTSQISPCFFCSFNSVSNFIPAGHPLRGDKVCMLTYTTPGGRLK